MQLRLQPRSKKSIFSRKSVFGTILFLIVFTAAIFLIDQIKISSPNKLIKQELSNDKLITLK
jgi:hypothetical protein